MVSASTSFQPSRRTGTTTAGLNTANAAAMTSPGTWPSTEPRLQKYAGPSGIATPAISTGLGAKPSASYARVTLGREVHLSGDRLDRRAERLRADTELVAGDHDRAASQTVSHAATIAAVHGFGGRPAPSNFRARPSAKSWFARYGGSIRRRGTGCSSASRASTRWSAPRSGGVPAAVAGCCPRFRRGRCW